MTRAMSRHAGWTAGRQDLAVERLDSAGSLIANTTFIIIILISIIITWLRQSP